MNVMNYTRRIESWQPGLKAASRDALLEAMLRQLCTEEFYQVNPELSHQGIFDALIAREGQRTTAVGEEIAFPHARLEHLKQALLAIGTLEKPVFFDEFPVRIVCLILVPANEPTVSLKLMAQLSRMLLDPAVHAAVLAARDTESLRNLVKEHNPRIDKPILARDIMRPPRHFVRESDPIHKCSHLLSVRNLPAVPVVNERKEILGQITVGCLFRYGLPDFFSKLKSVSFIAEFDPFEKYFADERNLLANEIMEDSAKTVPMDYTIMEVVFDLAVKNHPKLYVVDEAGRWVGTIDKATVLDNVINY